MPADFPFLMGPIFVLPAIHSESSHPPSAGVRLCRSSAVCAVVTTKAAFVVTLLRQWMLEDLQIRH
jgi:hypothetical protein